MIQLLNSWFVKGQNHHEKSYQHTLPAGNLWRSQKVRGHKTNAEKKPQPVSNLLTDYEQTHWTFLIFKNIYSVFFHQKSIIIQRGKLLSFF